MRAYYLLYNRINAFAVAWNIPPIIKYQALVWLSVLFASNVSSLIYLIALLTNIIIIKNFNFVLALNLIIVILIFINYYIFFKRKEYHIFVKEKLPEYSIKRVNIGVIIYIILTTALLSFVMTYSKNINI